jgi:pantoate--beta-alanine ligase
MLVHRRTADLLDWRNAIAPGTPIAFVPTMGYLHAGHLSLLDEARRRAGVDGRVVLSIFVNPTQFGPNEDLDRYPRDESGDLAKAASCGVDLAFCPSHPRELYPGTPAGTSSGAASAANTGATWVNVEGLDAHLCGRSRPGHFRGVCTVVCKLLGLVRPEVSLFGEKDFQQLAILRRMHADLFLPGTIVGMPIVREDDGLAMSSRNANLDPTARAAALAIPRFLAEVRRRFAAGERASAALVDGASSALAPGRVDYVEVVDAESLQPVAGIERPTLCAVAVHFGGVRLIDNTVLIP